MPCFWFQSDHVRLPGHVQTSDPPPQRLPAPGQRECHPRPRPCRTPACPFLSRAPGPLSPLPALPACSPLPRTRVLSGRPQGNCSGRGTGCSPFLDWFPTFTPSAVHTSSGTPEMPPSVMTGIVRPTVGIPQKPQLPAAPAAGKGQGRPRGVVSDGAERGGPGAHGVFPLLPAHRCLPDCYQVAGERALAVSEGRGGFVQGWFMREPFEGSCRGPHDPKGGG